MSEQSFQDLKRILVIDDDDFSRRIVCEMIHSLPDYQVLEASTIADAEEIMRDQIVDLIVLDLLMPERSGFDLLSVRRGSRAMTRRKVLVTSSLDDRESVVRAAQLGANDYLLKPVKRDALLTKLHKLLGEK